MRFVARTDLRQIPPDVVGSPVKAGGTRNARYGSNSDQQTIAARGAADQSLQVLQKRATLRLSLLNTLQYKLTYRFVTISQHRPNTGLLPQSKTLKRFTP
jgi:hypothetical protein